MTADHERFMPALVACLLPALTTGDAGEADA